MSGGNIPRELVTRARQTPPLRLLPERFPVRATGQDRWKLRCPLHDDQTPSLSVRKRDDGAWQWRCFGCGRGGDSIDFAMLVCGTPWL